jgi:hypothetical protein
MFMQYTPCKQHILVSKLFCIFSFFLFYPPGLLMGEGSCYFLDLFQVMYSRDVEGNAVVNLKGCAEHLPAYICHFLILFSTLVSFAP